MTFPNIKYELAVYFTLFFLLVCVIVWVRTATVKQTYQFVRNEKMLKSLENDLQLLKLKWAKATSVTHLQSLAREFDLRPLSPEQKWEVKE